MKKREWQVKGERVVKWNKEQTRYLRDKLSASNKLHAEMKCRCCGADLYSAEHLPTEENGTYVFRCGSRLEDGKWMESSRCKKNKK